MKMNQKGFGGMALVGIVLLFAVIGIGVGVYMGNVKPVQQLCNAWNPDTKQIAILNIPCDKIPFQAGGTQLVAVPIGQQLPTGTQIQQPVQQQVIQQPVFQVGSNLTSNPSAVFSVSDAVTNTVPAEAVIELYKAETLINSQTTSSGVVTFSNLTPNTLYSYEVRNSPTTATVFYPVGGTFTSLPAGSIDVPVKVFSTNGGTATLTIYNDDDTTANAGTAALAITTSDSVNFRVRVKLGASSNADQNRFGDGVIPVVETIDYNSSPTFSFSATMDGVILEGMGGNPNGHAITALARNASVSFKLAKNQLKSGLNYDIVHTVKNTSTIQPIDSNFALTYYDGCRVRNTETSNYVETYRDPVSSANICGANITGTVVTS